MQQRESGPGSFVSSAVDVVMTIIIEDVGAAVLWLAKEAMVKLLAFISLLHA